MSNDSDGNDATIGTDSIVAKSDPNWQQCHSLPCNIGYSGRAPVEVYFAPQLLLISDKDGKKDRVFAAQFRGRPLLSAEPYPQASTTTTSNHNMQGRLLEIMNGTKARSSEGKVQVRAKFNTIQEWKHEYDPDVVRKNASSNNRRVRAAMEWCDVAHALHEPIPL